MGTKNCLDYIEIILFTESAEVCNFNITDNQ